MICVKCIHYLKEDGRDFCGWYDVQLQADVEDCDYFAHKPKEEQ